MTELLIAGAVALVIVGVGIKLSKRKAKKVLPKKRRKKTRK